MFCKYCGENIADDAKFCKACGKKLINNAADKTADFKQVPDTISPVNLQNNFPKDVFYTKAGRLSWLFRDYERNPSGNYIIRLEFEDERITQYFGVDLDAAPDKGKKYMKMLNNLADVGMTLAILTGDSDMHWDSAELYDRTEYPDSVYNYYYYKKVTVVEKDSVTGWIYFKHGFDRFFLRVNPEQIDFIFKEFMKRCPNAVLGEVRKKKVK